MAQKLGIAKRQAGFFLQLTACGFKLGFPRVDVAAGQRPFQCLFATSKTLPAWSHVHLHSKRKLGMKANTPLFTGLAFR
ncbi:MULTISPECIES: hypothetical protein [Pseudomonas]|uniref:hypothetical protein n=1 Tax=Pseudomonas TaxID=286 RepID=UPI00046F05E0|nr:MULTISPECIES: hypothetical protein [Pseudomonas]MCJ7850754.1 hypothetical protein [Pseudomonas monteilii]